MSQENNYRSIISRYNFSRRFVDHRQHHDLNYSINKPILSKAWFGSAKNRLIGSVVYYFGAYVTGATILIGIGLVTIDSLWRMNSDSMRPSLLTQPYHTPAESFVSLNHDRTLNTGKWNHNFNCWENEKYCGRDFDWIRK